MKDSQFISELLMILVDKKMIGFDQDYIDKFYAEYDNIDTESFDQEEYLSTKKQVKQYIESMDFEIISKWSTSYNIYTLWALVALNHKNMPKPEEFTKRYRKFMEKVMTMNEGTDPSQLDDASPYNYYKGTKGATTDLTPRNARFNSLQKALLN